MAKRPTSRAKTPADPAATAAAKPKKIRAAAAAAEPSIDDIRRRAYERYLERGGHHGRHFDDWVEAEKELRSKK